MVSPSGGRFGVSAGRPACLRTTASRLEDSAVPRAATESLGCLSSSRTWPGDASTQDDRPSLSTYCVPSPGRAERKTLLPRG